MFGLKKDKRIDRETEIDTMKREIDREFRQQANQRMYDLEEKIEKICQHLGIVIYKQQGFTVQNRKSAVMGQPQAGTQTGGYGLAASKIEKND